MFGMIFACLWTVLSTAMIVAGFDDLEPWERAVALLFPLFGLVVLHVSWLHLRRRRSLRTEEDGGTTWYVWIEIDGSVRRSTCDPRADWDGDGDGDGDGGGGD